MKCFQARFFVSNETMKRVFWIFEVHTHPFVSEMPQEGVFRKKLTRSEKWGELPKGINELEEGQQPISSSLNLLSGFRVVPGGTCADIRRTPSPAQSNGKKRKVNVMVVFKLPFTSEYDEWRFQTPWFWRKTENINTVSDNCVWEMKIFIRCLNKYTKNWKVLHTSHLKYIEILFSPCP